MDLSEYLCIVPARTGSKRLPDKNFLDFCGKPLWMWSVDCASRAGVPPHPHAFHFDTHTPPLGFAVHTSSVEVAPLQRVSSWSRFITSSTCSGVRSGLVGCSTTTGPKCSSV